MRAEEHFEIIHHTGARLTHDIKNILQSIKASIDIVQIQPEDQQSAPLKLLKQNLDQISLRLASTLKKLKAPELSNRVRYLSINEWLANFKNEQGHEKIRYQDDIDINHDIPPDLFDSVINNLISNALMKEDASEVIIDITSNREMIVVTVCDNGKNINSDVENQLFNKPVSSGQGMGIGLYQSSIMARAYNYELELANNQAGKVCFSLFQHLGD